MPSSVDYAPTWAHERARQFISERIQPAHQKLVAFQLSIRQRAEGQRKETTKRRVELVKSRIYATRRFYRTHVRIIRPPTDKNPHTAAVKRKWRKWFRGPSPRVPKKWDS
jgi:hypothetical protein